MRPGCFPAKSVAMRPPREWPTQHEALDAERGGDALEIADVELVVVAALGVVPRVAVAAQIEGEGAVVGRHLGREVVVDVGLVAEAVEQHEGHPLVAPLEHVDREPVGAGDELRERGCTPSVPDRLRSPRPRFESSRPDPLLKSVPLPAVGGRR